MTRAQPFLYECFVYLRRDRKHLGKHSARLPGTPQSHCPPQYISIRFFSRGSILMMTDERASRPQTFEETVIKFRQWLKIEPSSFCAARLNYSRLVSASVQGIKTNNPVDLICIKFIPSVPYFFFCFTSSLRTITVRTASPPHCQWLRTLLLS
jgi:hypothetical protein